MTMIHVCLKSEFTSHCRVTILFNVYYYEGTDEGGISKAAHVQIRIIKVKFTPV